MLMEKHFRLMKKTAIFINTGRGPTVQEAGLIKALEERLDRPCRPRRAGNRAARQQQSAAGDAQRHAERAHRLGVRPVRSGAQAACRARTGAGAERQMADELRQPGGADEHPSCAAGSRFRWNAGRTARIRMAGRDPANHSALPMAGRLAMDAEGDQPSHIETYSAAAGRGVWMPPPTCFPRYMNPTISSSGANPNACFTVAS